MTDLEQHTAEGREVDVDWLRLIKTNHDVHVRVADKVDVGRLPPHNGLLSVANSRDLFAVGGGSNVLVHRLSSLHTSLENAPKDANPSLEPMITLALAASPTWVRFAHGESVLLVIDAHGVLSIYQVPDLVAGRVAPRRIEQGVPAGVVDVLPNPASRTADGISRHVMIIGEQGSAMLDVETGEIRSWPGTYTCGAWSTKGKQIVLGTPSGTLETFTPDHAPKSLVPRPEQDFDGFVPRSVLWLENDVFLAQYGEAEADSFSSLEVVVISRSKTDITFTRFFDPINTMGYASEGPTSAHRHVSALRQWGASTRHLAFILSGLASEVGVLHAGQGGWEVAMLDEAARAIMPTGTGGGDDTSCIGMDLDLTSTVSIRRGMEGGVEMPDIPPAPRLLVYSQEGFIISFDVRYPDAGSYPGMVKPGEFDAAPSARTASESPAAPPESTPAPITSAPNAATPPSAAAPASGGSAFGKPPAASAFGGFGQSTSTSLNQPSPFGAASTSDAPGGAESKPNVFAGFGQQASSIPAKPAFAGFGAQNSATPSASPSTATTTGSAFGQSAFGSSTPAFGQSGFGKSAFGQPSTPGASGSAFGQSAFGSTAASATGSTPASGSAFGGFGKPASSGSAFGQSGFGPSAFGQSTTPSSTPAKPSAPSAFGASAFGASAFGQSTTPSTTPAKSGGSAFGTSGFGASAFGQSTTPAATPAKPTEGQAAPSAFGSSAFGQSAFGQGAAAPTASSGGFAGFGRAASAASSAAPSSTPAPARATTPDSSAGDVDSDRDDDEDEDQGDNFGVKGFSLALDDGSRSPAARLEHSPPSSPLFGKHATQPVSRDSRAQGGFKLGSSPDTPPDSPPFAPAPDIKKQSSETQSQSQSQSYAAFGTSSSGAFGASSNGAGAFGAFGGGSSSKSGGAFGSFGSGNAAPAGGTSSTTPAATPAKSPSGGGSGAPAFGQSSTPSGTTFGQKSAFGSSGFGSSAFGSSGFGASASGPAFGSGSAFGSAAKASPGAGGFGGFAKPTFTPSSGGFGGFAAAAKGEAEKATGKSGGFGGFASAKSEAGASVFGSQADKPAASTGGFAGFGKKEQSSVPVAESKMKEEARAPVVVEPEPAPMPAGYDAPGPVDGEPADEAKVEAAIPLPPAAPAEAEPTLQNADEARGEDVEEEDEAEKEGTPSPDIQTVSSASSRGSGDHADEDEGELVQHEDAVEGSHILEAQVPGGKTSAQHVDKGDGRQGEPEVFEARVGAVFIEHEGDVEDVAGPAEGGTVDEALEEGQHSDEEGDEDGQDEDGDEDEEDDDDDDDNEEDDEDDDEDDLSESDDEYDRSVSFPPEMPVIAEEEEDDDASLDGRNVNPTITVPAAQPSAATEPPKPAQTLKSPPTWFAKSTPSAFGSAGVGGLGLGAPPPSPSPKTAGGDGSSLFSRIGAPVTAPLTSSEAAKDTERLSPSSATLGQGDAPVKPLLSSPHAVRASSPLGSQPPASASDAKSPVDDLSDASAHDKEKQGSKSAAPSASASAFGFGKPTAASGTSAGSGFGFGSSSFGQKSGSEAESKPLFGLSGAQLAPPASTAKEERKPSFGFGAAPPAFGQGAPAPADSQDDKPKPKDKPAFAGFGLGLGQPSTAQSTAAAAPAPALGAQTGAKPSFGFGAPPPAFGSAADTKSTPGAPTVAPQTGAGAFGGFGGFGQKADVAKAVPAPTATVEPSKPFGSGGFGGFGGFGAKPASPASATPTASTPTSTPAPSGFFGFGKPAQNVQTPETAAKPSSGAPAPAPGLGLGRPSAAPIATPTLPATAQAPESPAPAPKPKPLPPAPAYFTVPKREYVSAAPKASTKGGVKGMSETLKDKVDDLVADIDAIKAMLAAAKKHQAAFVIPNFAKITRDNVEEHQSLPFSSIGDTMALARALVEELQELRKGEEGEEKVIGDLQARMAKSDVKRQQLEQLAEARDKPDFAQVLVTHELSPEQETSQITLRAAMAEVQARLGELEAGLAYLKDRSSGRGDASLSASVSEATRSVQSTLLDRQQTIEDLSRRLNTVRLDSPSTLDAREKSGPPARDGQQGRSGPGTDRADSPLRAFLSPLPAFLTFKSSSALRVPAAIEAEVREAVQRQEARRGLLQRLRQRPTREHGVESVDVKGAVEVDDVPKPSRLDRDEQGDVEPDVEVKTEPQADVEGAADQAEPSSNPTSPPSLGSGSQAQAQAQAGAPSFAGISINFSAAATSPLSASAAKGHGPDRGGGGSRRKVAPAAKYEPHAAAAAAAAPPASDGDGVGVRNGSRQQPAQSAPRFDFGFGGAGGPGGGGGESAQKPKGFFSFDGLGK